MDADLGFRSEKRGSKNGQNKYSSHCNFNTTSRLGRFETLQGNHSEIHSETLWTCVRVTVSTREKLTIKNQLEGEQSATILLQYLKKVLDPRSSPEICVLAFEGIRPSEEVCPVRRDRCRSTFQNVHHTLPWLPGRFQGQLEVFDSPSTLCRLSVSGHS